MKKLILFDIDGTLLRSGYAGRRSIARAFRDAFDVSESMEGIDFLGRSDPELFQTIARTMMGRQLSPAEYEQVIGLYLSYFPEELAKSELFQLMPGVPALLEELAECDDIILGLQTGNLEQSARMKLMHGGIDHHFATGGFGSDSEFRAEIIRKGIERMRRLHNEPLPENTVYIIEDSPYGIRSGHEAGVKSIAVGTGWVSREELDAESPTFFLADLRDIPAFFQCLNSEEP